MSCINSSDPYLPLELERLIFELVVSENSTKASTPLLLVAKRVREWTKPLIFRVINQMWHPGPQDFVTLPRLLQSAGPFVQHLMIDGCSDKKSLSTIVSSCPNVRNLAIHLPLFYEGIELNRLLPLLQGMPRLSRLTVAILSISYDEFLTQPFLNLTHLEVMLGFTHSFWEEQCEVLTQLPKLTHINVGSAVRADHVLKLLLSPLLIILIVVPYYHSRPDEDLKTDDNLLVLLECHNDSARILDWERGTNGGMDTWTFSELVVLARGKKHFLIPLPKWIPRTFDWEKYLNEDGGKWFSELRLNKH